MRAFLPTPVERDQVVLAPGSRADLLVRARNGNGRYRLITDTYDRGRMSMRDGAPAAGPVTLATLIASGLAMTSPPTPGTLPTPPTPSGATSRQRQITFAMGMGMGGAMIFVIDGRRFDPDRDDQMVELGTIEEWTVVNTSPMDHPFHLHAWPFQVLATSIGTQLTGTRHDVVLVPRQG